MNDDHLPDDHFAVMKAATKYSFIDEKAVLGMLGFFGEKLTPSGRKVRGYLKPRKSLPTRLCSRSIFSKLIAKNVTVNIVGIPQGLPISDVLANAVLLDFDKQMKLDCFNIGGLYRRYSDDLLFIIPGISTDPKAFIHNVEGVLSNTCKNLKLGHNKSAAFTVKQLASGDQQVTPIASYKAIPTIDYLGLSYDGQSIYLRQSTLARLRRRIVLRVRRQVLARFTEDQSATAQQIHSKLNLEGIMREFGRIEIAHRKSKTHLSHGPKRSFRCYAVRASEACGFKVSKILKQISDLKGFIRARAKIEVARIRP